MNQHVLRGGPGRWACLVCGVIWIGCPSSWCAALPSAPRARRARAIAWAWETLRRTDVLILGSVATGEGAEDELVELVLMGLDGRVIVQTVLRPMYAHGPDGAALGGVPAAVLARAPAIPDIATPLALLLEETTILTHTAQRTRRLLAQSYAAYGYDRPRAVGWEDVTAAWGWFLRPQRGRDAADDGTAFGAAQATRARIRHMALADADRPGAHPALRVRPLVHATHMGWTMLNDPPSAPALAELDIDHPEGVDVAGMDVAGMDVAGVDVAGVDVADAGVLTPDAAVADEVWDVEDDTDAITYAP